MMNKKVNDSIIKVKNNQNDLVFEVEEPFYILELLEDYNVSYIHKHFYDENDLIYVEKSFLMGNILKEFGDIGYVGVCRRCGCEVVYDKDLMSGEYNSYKGACLNCDEDLWFYEIEFWANDDVKRFVSESDKNYYRENGYLPCL